MTDFDPNVEPETSAQADAYVNWCAENFMRLSEGPPRIYRTAVRCAHWLLVVSVAQLHLDEEAPDHDALLDQLANYSRLARALERQRQRFNIERFLVLRAGLDCWQPQGMWADHLLGAAKCAVTALIAIEMHPLIDLWELECPDVWALLTTGRDLLGMINMDETLSFADFAVTRSEEVAAKFTWQRANNLVRHVGMPPLSAN